MYMSFTVAARSEESVCGHSSAEIVGSNPTRGTDVCLLYLLCAVRYRSLRRADQLSRIFLSALVLRCV